MHSPGGTTSTRQGGASQKLVTEETLFLWLTHWWHWYRSHSKDMLIFTDVSLFVPNELTYTMWMLAHSEA